MTLITPQLEVVALVFGSTANIHPIFKKTNFFAKKSHFLHIFLYFKSRGTDNCVSRLFGPVSAESA
jgi:hypothetical protein